MAAKYDWRKYYNRRKAKQKALKTKELQNEEAKSDVVLTGVVQTTPDQTINPPYTEEKIKAVKESELRKKKPIVPEGSIRVGVATMKFATALACADMIADNLTHLRKIEHYQNGKGREYIRGLEEKIEYIRRTVRKAREKNN